MTGTDDMIYVNGTAEALSAPTIAALLERLGITPETRGVAVAVNGAVVTRSHWAETRIAAQDRIEIIRAMQGG